MRKFDMVPNKYTLIFLASILVVGLGIMAYSLSKSKTVEIPKNEIKQIKTLSESTELESIENDLTDTNVSDLDNELSKIELELTY